MFDVTTKPEFTHTVTVMVPTDGGHSESDFKARFRVLEVTETDEFDLNNTDGLIAFLKAAVVSFDDLVNGKKEPVVYNNALRDQMLALPYVRLALLRTYMSAVTKARIKN